MGKLDNLAQDVIAGEALGYGPHYGYYKVDHPNTKAEREAVAELMEKQQTKIVKGYDRCCAHCGKRFLGRYSTTIYCSEQCKVTANNARYRQRKKAEKENKKHEPV